MLRRRSHAAGALLYGRALYLPPPALPSHVHPPEHAIVAGLRPFQTRLHLQRAVLIFLRTLVLTALIAIVILCVRLGGVAMSLPLTPLIAAGVVLFLGLCALVWQRPSAFQMAHALDQRLRLREQIGSALDLEPTGNRLAALLYQRAGNTLRLTHPADVLPWPSLRRETNILIVLSLLTGFSAVLAAHAPPVRSVAAGKASSKLAGQRDVLTHRAGGDVHGIHLLPLGSSSRVRLVPVLRGGQGHLVTGSRPAAGHGGQAGHPALSGQALRLHPEQGSGHGSGAPVGSKRSGGSVPTQSVAGGTKGSGATLHLTSGKNSATGGVTNPQQQALLNLQNSVSSAANPRGQNNSGTNNTSSTKNNGGQNQAQSGRRTGRRTTGHSGAQGQGTNSASGKRSGGSSSVTPGSAGSGSHTPGGGRIPNNDDPRYSHRGSTPGAQDPLNTGPTTRGQATLGHSTGGELVLGATPGKDGRLIISLGGPDRVPGIGGASLFGSNSNAAVTVPGYVAPDSNTISPDDRGMVQGYFSPPTSGQ